MASLEGQRAHVVLGTRIRPGPEQGIDDQVVVIRGRQHQGRVPVLRGRGGACCRATCSTYACAGGPHNIFRLDVSARLDEELTDLDGAHVRHPQQRSVSDSVSLLDPRALMHLSKDAGLVSTSCSVDEVARRRRNQLNFGRAAELAEGAPGRVPRHLVGVPTPETVTPIIIHDWSEVEVLWPVVRAGSVTDRQTQ